MAERRAISAVPAPIILPYQGVWPTIDPSAFIAPNAVVIGDVVIGPEASVLFNATVRGDIAPVRIGARSNVQDGAVLHVNQDAPCILGDDVTVGHGAIVHGTTVEDGVLIGMGAIVMSYSRIGSGATIAAGALIPERTEVPAGAVMVGVPAKERQALDERQREALRQIAGRYVGVGATYRQILRDLSDPRASDEEA